MSIEKAEKKGSEQRFKIDRKLIIAITFFAVAGLLLMGVSNLSTSTISSLRAYSSLQGNWTQERKDAAFHLDNYIEERRPEFYRKFKQAVGYIETVKEARQLMDAEPVEYGMIREKLKKSGVHEKDISNMIRTYVWLNELRYFDEVVKLWIKSDRLVGQLNSLAERIHTHYQERERFREDEKSKFRQQVQSIDKKLDEAQNGINRQLAMGVRLLETITFWSTTGAGLLLFVIGFLFTYRFRSSIRQWRNMLLRNEKRYRSLFDENPNAVFSLDHQGQFISGNEALERMTGYSKEELRQMTYLPLVHPQYEEIVREKFAQVLKGEPQSYESVGVHRDGSHYEVYVTNLPIIIDGEVEGAYGIAQDITDRKVAERRLRESLEEKKTLLAEIHHRVKNNLAVISGLLDLQAENVKEDKLKYDFLNTRSRIHSMAMVHEKLYKSESLASIKMKGYVKDLAEAIRQSMNVDKKIYFEYECDQISLDITQAIPCGLLLNEIIVNAFKYAFEGRDEGKIKIYMRKTGNEITIRIADNGVGLPEDVDFSSSSSLGLTLINTLTKQLKGALQVDRSDGTSYELTFERKEAEFYQTRNLANTGNGNREIPKV